MGAATHRRKAIPHDSFTSCETKRVCFGDSWGDLCFSVYFVAFVHVCLSSCVFASRGVPHRDQIIDGRVRVAPLAVKCWIEGTRRYICCLFTSCVACLCAVFDAGCMTTASGDVEPAVDVVKAKDYGVWQSEAVAMLHCRMLTA